MQTRLGHDFSGVRVHTGPEADRAAREVAAVAFTTGDDVFLGADADRPGSAQGDRLLVHELAHVVQQREASRVADGVSAPGDAAERAAHAVAAGGPLVRAGGTVAAVQRQAKLSITKRVVTRDDVQAELTDYLTRVMQEQGRSYVLVTELVKRTVRNLFTGIEGGTALVGPRLEKTMVGDPDRLAAIVVGYLPAMIPDENLIALQHAPVKEDPGRPKTVGEKVHDKAKEQLGKIGHPEESTESPADHALPPAARPEPTAQSPGQHMGSTPPIPWGDPSGKARPKPAVPQAGPGPQVEAAIASIDPGALVPAGARNASDFPDARGFARAVAWKLYTQDPKSSSVNVELGSAYAEVKDRVPIYESVRKIVRTMCDALPDKASGVTTVWVKIDGKSSFPMQLSPPAD
jgi:hypothetical protein